MSLPLVRLLAAPVCMALTALTPVLGATQGMMAIGWFVSAAVLAMTMRGTHRDSRRIGRLLDVMRAHAKGDLRPRLVREGPGEIEDLVAAEGVLASYLQAMVGQIAASGRKLAESIQVLNASVQELSGRLGTSSDRAADVAAAASQNAGNVDSISAATEEVSTSVASIAAMLEEMSASISEVEGNSRQQAVQAEQVRALSDSGRQAMTKLADASQEIRGIATQIAQIAGSTNLLALNATIEAARAGSAGRGFTVVAGEVKQLAGETAQATDGIRERVERMGEQVESVVAWLDSMSSAVDLVHQGSQTLRNAMNEQTRAVAESARNVAESRLATRDVARHLAEAAQGTRIVSRSIVDIRDHSVEARQAVQAIEKQALALRSQGEELGALVASFRIEARRFELTPALRTGATAMDEQHSRLFELVNDLSAAIDEGRPREALLPILDGLASYTLQHFADEEELMRRNQFRGLDAHLAIHRAFEAKVIQARTAFAAGTGTLGASLIDFLVEWLTTHIGKTDRQDYGVRR